MRTVWKYPLSVEDVQAFRVSTDAKIVNVDVQNSKPCIWIELDDEALCADLRVALVGTGHKIPEGGVYRGTFVTMGGFLVIHVYELPPEAVKESPDHD